jgi:hypothetical protein
VLVLQSKRARTHTYTHTHTHTTAQDPAVAAVFASLWTERARLAAARRGRPAPPAVQARELLSSSDGVSVYLGAPGERGGFHRDGRDWLHWDRSPADPVHSVQGLVNLLPTGPGGAAFQALVGSHAHQREFTGRFPAAAAQRFHLLASQAEADLYVREKRCAHVCVAAAPGDLVLWDSRTVHCGRAAARGAALLRRAVVYVAMQPRALATPRDLELKRRAHAQRRATTHNAAAGVELFPMFPRVRSARDARLKEASRPVARPPRLSTLGRALFGL